MLLEYVFVCEFVVIVGIELFWFYLLNIILFIVFFCCLCLVYMDCLVYSCLYILGIVCFDWECVDKNFLYLLWWYDLWYYWL